MLNGGNIPPLNFYVQITEAQIKRAKGMYENMLKSLELPKSITADYLSNFHYDSREELYEDWLARWDQQLGYLSFYLRYQSLQIAMKKGSTAQTAAMYTLIRSCKLDGIFFDEKYAYILKKAS